MTARKTSSGKKKTPADKASSRKKAAAGTKAAAGKASSRKKAATGKKTPAGRVGSRKKVATGRKAPAAKGAPAPKSKLAEKREPDVPARRSAAKGKQRRGEFKAVQVNLGHVFALRPRVSKTFRQEDFRTARLLLEDESYASLDEAARAVVEKALSLTRDKKPGRGRRPGP